MKIWLIIGGVLVVLYLLYRGYASQSATTSSTSAATAVPATGDLGATPTVGSSTAPTTYFPRVPSLVLRGELAFSLAFSYIARCR